LSEIRYLYGVRPIVMAAQFAYEQKIVPRAYTVEELFRPEIMDLQ
jgi:hypothetical protein